MKKAILFSSLFAILFFTSFYSNAQVAVNTATIDANMNVILDTNAPLATDYVIDFSHMNFKNEQAAITYFRSFTDNLVKSEVNYAEKKLILHLQTQYTSDKGWAVNEWNQYFAQTSARYRATYEKVNRE